MKNKVLFRLLILVGIANLGYQQEAFSQAAKSEGFMVVGKVNDAEGNKAVGATIVVKGTTKGTVTDVDGLFSIEIPTEQATLLIKHFSSSQVWEDSFEAGKEYIIRLAPDSVSVSVPIFDRVEENPRPTTGDDGWYAYLSKNIKYSQNDRQTGVEGTVIVGFQIHADGSVQNVEVLRGIGGESDMEAIRVVSAGPNWEPGKIGGEAVNTRMSMPIQFKLSGASESNSLAKSRETAIAKLYGKEGVVVIGYLPTASR